jgi:hypothetical protein
VAGEVALEQPCGVAAAFSFGDPFGDVFLRRRVVLAAVQDDRMQCAVELSVAAAAEGVVVTAPDWLREELRGLTTCKLLDRCSRSGAGRA